MSDISKIGVNTRAIDQDLQLGKKIGTFNNKEDAINKAENTKGSELVYKTEDGKWGVSELTEKGWLTDNQYSLGSIDKNKIEIDQRAITDKGIKDYEISFSDEKSPLLEIAINGKHDSQVNLSQRTDVDENVLFELAKSSFTQPRVILALNPTSSPKVLQELAKSGKYDVQRALLNNPNTWKDNETQKILSKSNFSNIEQAIAAYSQGSFIPSPPNSWPIAADYSAPEVKIQQVNTTVINNNVVNNNITINTDNVTIKQDNK